MSLPRSYWRNLVLGRPGMAEPITEALRQLVTARAQGRCEYCQSPEAYATARFSIEHIRPRSLQGPTVPANLALACQGCNGYKSAQTTSLDPETGETVDLFRPRRHVWGEHFTWSANGLYAIYCWSYVHRQSYSCTASDQPPAACESAPRPDGYWGPSVPGISHRNSGLALTSPDLLAHR